MQDEFGQPAPASFQAIKNGATSLPLVVVGTAGLQALLYASHRLKAQALQLTIPQMCNRSDRPKT